MAKSLKRFLDPHCEAEPDLDPRTAAFRKLCMFVGSKTSNTELAWTTACKIHNYVRQYEMSLRALRSRKTEGRIEIGRVAGNRKAVASLERLATAAGDYARKKAFLELVPAAKQALFLAAEQNGRSLVWKEDQDFLFVPDGEIVRSLVPDAIKIASEFTRTNPACDRAEEEIFRAYRHLLRRRPAGKRAITFREVVQACYKEVIPEGFGGGVRANNTFDARLRRITKRSLTD
jgi:hypothetical protein